MIFIGVAALMLLLAGLVVAVPLWRARVPAHTGVAAANREVHAARLVELQQDLDAGRLSADDHVAARRDLDRDLSIAVTHDSAVSAGKPQKLASSIALALTLVIGAGLYWFYGDWHVGAQGVETASAQAVVEMVDKLAQRLQTPGGQNDLQGWDMLGHSYMIMGRYNDALQAFDHARQLSSDNNPQELAGYAEALTLSDPDAFTDKAAPIFENVLKMDPRNVQALWYGGLGALQRGDKSLAIQRWQAILDQYPPADYRRYIAKAIIDAGGKPAEVSADVFIQMQVSLTQGLTARLAPDTAVFVYAQPKDGSAGPPLAARRFQVKDLPLVLKLSDQDAVVPGRTISAYDEVVVTARVSKSGNALPQAGDMIGRGEWSKAIGKPLAIVIDTVVK